MKIAEIRDRIAGITTGGIITDEQRFEPLFLNSIINAVRGEIVRIKFQQSKYIHPNYYQKYYPEYSADLQTDDKCTVKFLCPRPISLDDFTDGHRYIGTIDGVKNFRRIRSRGQLSNYNKHRVMNVNNNRATSVLYDANEGVIEVYGNLELREMLVESVFGNPFEIPLYNTLKDNYPMPDNDVPMLEGLLRNPTESMVQKVIDLLPNSNDLAEQIKKAVYRKQ